MTSKVALMLTVSFVIFIFLTLVLWPSTYKDTIPRNEWESKYKNIEMREIDRKIMILTVMGEAANQDDIGRAAVAAVILNRALHGGFGGHRPKDVCLYKIRRRTKSGRMVTTWQFEPWMHKNIRKWLLTAGQNHYLYDHIGQIVDKVYDGSIPDPTGGALYFYNEEIVRRRLMKKGVRRRKPDFDTVGSTSITIGQHKFIRP